MVKTHQFIPYGQTRKRQNLFDTRIFVPNVSMTRQNESMSLAIATYLARRYVAMATALHQVVKSEAI
jgi:hypothetical protein